MNKRHREILASLAPAIDIAMTREARPGNARTPVVNALSADTTEIMIYGDIGGSMWDGGGVSAVDMAEILRNVMTPNILVRINSRGGDAFDGVAIHSLLANHSATVTTQVDGVAASAASVIMMAGDRINVARNALVMIHDAMTATYGNGATHARATELLDKVSGNIADMYSVRAGGTVEEWRNLMTVNGEDGSWFTGQEAVASGLADAVTNDTADPSVTDEARAMLARFKGAPQMSVPEIEEPDVNDIVEALESIEPVTVPDNSVANQGFALLAAFTFGS